MLIDLALGREEQDRRVRIGDKQVGDKVLLPCGHTRAPLAPAVLRAIGGKRHALDIAGVGYGYDHILARDKVLNILLKLNIFNDGAAGAGELFLSCQQLLPDYGVELFA